jgi:hypothetical protein
VRPIALVVLIGSIALAPWPAAADDDDGGPAYAPTDRYETRRIEGWSVLVSKDLLRDQPALADRALDLLRHQLYQVGRRVPAGAALKLRTVRIWVEEREPHHPCMTYHPSPGWLREHGMNPEKARCVEVSNVRNFLDWTRDQPWMVLHELAHAYHNQFLEGSFDNARVKDAYEQAKAAGLYRSVLGIDGKERRAYAETDPMEYFAEASEAYFGTNDFDPFVRSELRRHDPRVYALLETHWGGA